MSCINLKFKKNKLCWNHIRVILSLSDTDQGTRRLDLRCLAALLKVYWQFVLVSNVVFISFQGQEIY